MAPFDFDADLVPALAKAGTKTKTASGASGTPMTAYTKTHLPSTVAYLYLFMLNFFVFARRRFPRWFFIGRMALLAKVWQAMGMKQARPLQVHSAETRLWSNMHLRRALFALERSGRLDGLHTLGIARNKGGVVPLYFSVTTNIALCVRHKRSVAFLVSDLAKAYDTMQGGSTMRNLRNWGFPESFASLMGMVVLMLLTVYYEGRVGGIPAFARRVRTSLPQGLSLACLISCANMLPFALWLSYGDAGVRYRGQPESIPAFAVSLYFDDLVVFEELERLPAQIVKLEDCADDAVQKFAPSKMPLLILDKGLPREGLLGFKVAGIELPNVMSSEKTPGFFRLLGGQVGATPDLRLAAISHTIVERFEGHVAAPEEEPLTQPYFLAACRDRTPQMSLQWHLKMQLPSMAALKKVQACLVSFVMRRVLHLPRRTMPRLFIFLEINRAGLGFGELVRPILRYRVVEGGAREQYASPTSTYGLVPSKLTTMYIYDQLMSFDAGIRFLAFELARGLEPHFSFPRSAKDAASWSDTSSLDVDGHGAAMRQFLLFLRTVRDAGVAMYVSVADGTVKPIFFDVATFTRTSAVRTVSRANLVRRINAFFRADHWTRLGLIKSICSRFAKLRHYAAPLVFDVVRNPTRYSALVFSTIIRARLYQTCSTPGADWVRNREASCCGLSPVWPFHYWTRCDYYHARFHTPRHNEILLHLAESATEYGRLTHLVADHLKLDGPRGSSDLQRPDLVCLDATTGSLIIVEVTVADDVLLYRKRAEKSATPVAIERKFDKYETLFVELKEHHPGLKVKFAAFVVGALGAVSTSSFEALRLLGVPPPRRRIIMREVLGITFKWAVRIDQHHAKSRATDTADGEDAAVVAPPQQPSTDALAALAASHGVQIDQDFTHVADLRTHTMAATDEDISCASCSLLKRVCCSRCQNCTACAFALPCPRMPPTTAADHAASGMPTEEEDEDCELFCDEALDSDLDGDNY